jgi:hypothetical protein
VIRHSASLHWLPRATVRQLHRYYQSAPTSHHPSRPAPFRSPGGTTDCCSPRGSAELLLPAPRRYKCRCLNPLPSTHTRGDGGISQVPRQPLCEHALLFDPGGPSASGHCDAPDVAFRAVDGVGPHSVTFRGSITLPVRSLSTLRSSDHSDGTPRKTRFPLAAKLVGTGLSPGLSPAGLLKEVSTLCSNSHRFLFLAAFLAHQPPGRHRTGAAVGSSDAGPEAGP